MASSADPVQFGYRTGKFRRRLRWFLIACGISVCIGAIYIRMHPLVFNESFWGHAHCIKIAGGQLYSYADSHNGKFPAHPDGYGNALLLLDPSADFTYTGPGYDPAAFKEARRTGRSLAEEDCGRVYVQGLKILSDHQIIILFDKIATPGGDHCHFIGRLWAALGREVLQIDGTMRFVRESDWAAFASEQVELLVKAGIRREEAERLYSLAIH